MGEEYSNWGYLWSGVKWKHRYIVVAPGELRVYLSEGADDHQAERKVALDWGVSVQIVDSETYLSRSNFCLRLTRRSFSGERLLQGEGAVVIVTSSDRKRLSILTSEVNEAEMLRDEIEKSSVEVNNSTHVKARAAQRLLLGLSSLRRAVSEKNLKREFQRAPPWTSISIIRSTPLDSTGLESLRDCTEFLKLQSWRYQQAFQIAGNMVDRFNGSYHMGDCFISNELRIEAWKGVLLKIVRALREELVEAPLSEADSERLWLACETWVMARAHEKIMGACEQMFAAEDRELSSIQCKLREVDPSLLGVNASLKHVAFGEAMKTFGTINSYRTPLEKAACLRKTVNLVLEGISSRADEDKMPCTDDLLSLMLLLMAHSKVRHLQSTACYVENFFQIHDQQSSGELRYHITNFVAACTYLSSPDIKHLVSDIVIVSPTSSTTFSSPNSSDSSSRSEFLKLLDSSSELSSSSSTGLFTVDSSPDFILAPTYL